MHWADIYAKNVVTGMLNTDQSGHVIQTNANIVPDAHDAYTLGKDGINWAQVFTTSVKDVEMIGSPDNTSLCITGTPIVF